MLALGIAVPTLLIGAAFGIGFVIGPAVGGWLGMYSTRLPFWVAGAASLLNAIYGLFILPESLLLESRQTRIQWKRANPIGALRVFRSHAELWGLAGVNFLGYLAHEIYATVWILYVMYRFDWDQRMVGAGLAFAGVCSVICSGGLVGPTVARLGERRTLLLGLICGGLGFLLYGWAATVPTFFVAIAVNSLWSLANPASQSLMTRRVSASEQGELQGAIASLRGLAMIIGPPVFAEIFAFSLHGDHQQPSAPWYFAALLLAISLPVAWFVMKRNEGGAVHDCIVPVEVETNVE